MPAPLRNNSNHARPIRAGFEAQRSLPDMLLGAEEIRSDIRERIKWN